MSREPWTDALKAIGDNLPPKEPTNTMARQVARSWFRTSSRPAREITLIPARTPHQAEGGRPSPPDESTFCGDALSPLIADDLSALQLNRRHSAQNGSREGRGGRSHVLACATQ
jgi:hypothetical protein